MIKKDLFRKYDTPVPRYTSYPTVPYWSENPSTDQWIQALCQGLEPESSTWSMYIHVPYCESLCTYCGCNTVITRNHQREAPYVDTLLKEWEIYLQKAALLQQKPLRELHIGGGTPTFLSAAELKRLIQSLQQQIVLDQNFCGSIEVDPRKTNTEQLAVLRELGFRRISLGVQDFNYEVQRLVNRIQPFSITEKLTHQARELGYNSVNFDLIYGLPKQSMEHMQFTIEKTLELRPDRIALYSLAIVPWIKPAQRLFKDEDLPHGECKRALYEMSREKLLAAGYVEIGMDHFSLPNDTLTLAQKNKSLHRNFMGYTDQRTDVLLGLGVSAISETPTCFHQNEKALPVYERRVINNEVPTLRGHLLTQQDQEQRELILKFMTQFEVELKDQGQADDLAEFLKELIEDGLVELDGKTLRMTDQGNPFLRNACVGLDQRLRQKAPDTRIFSQSV